jgi:hypothetical protein
MSTALTGVAFAGLALVIANIFFLFSGIVKDSSKSLLILNDSGSEIRFSVLKDDGDNANNKSLSEPQGIAPYGESIFRYSWSGTYCITLTEKDGSIVAKKFVVGSTPSQTTRTKDSWFFGKTEIPVHFISKLDEPCDYQLEPPFAKTSDRPAVAE